MGTRTKRTNVRNGAEKHLGRALEIEDSAEKDFHLRQALQYLEVAVTNT